MTNRNSETPNGDLGNVLIYQSEDSTVKLQVHFEDENVWLTQQMMAELFDTTQQNISLHIQNIYTESELAREATYKKYLLVRKEGNRDITRSIDYYNLDMIISVGYRVKSIVATRFRIWATQKLKEYLVKGFVLDDERLKNPPGVKAHLPDYYDELLERIRDIRASEKRMYLRVRELFAMADDYRANETETNLFFSIMQNKLHFAATGLTAAEIINSRASHLLPSMGLTTWKETEIRKTDVTIAKNYLNEAEIAELNRIVVMWLDYAEDQVLRRKKIFLKDWETKLNEFIAFNDREVLLDSGKVNKAEADSHAMDEYEQFASKRREEKEISGAMDTLKVLETRAKLIRGKIQ